MKISEFIKKVVKIGANVCISDSIGYGEADRLVRRNSKKSQRNVKKLAFLVFSFPSFKRFENILDHLPNDIFDIVYNCDDAHKIKKVVQQRGYSCRSLASVLARNEIYAVAVSNLMWFSWHISKFLPNLLARSHIRVIYSGGFSREVLGHNHNYIYSKILCYGPYQQRILQKENKASVVSVGNPVLDRYFWETFDTRALNSRIDVRKKTIAWLTTVSEASSIREFLPIMESLKDKYNVFINPHSLTNEEDLELLKKSKLKNQIITEDNLELLAKADFVICDYGGAVFRALYLGKNIILFNPTNAKSSSLLTEDSPEVLLREKIINFSCTQEQEIIKILEDEKYWIDQQKVREAIFEEFFEDERGSSSYKVANILKQDLQKELNHLRD